MTDQLKALLELRYSFLPHGYEKEVPIAFKKPDGSLGEPLGKYQRINTTVRDPFTIFDMQQHGLTIERIPLTYSP
jgi:hypothetical protein